MNKFPFADFNQINNEMNDLGLKSHEKLAHMHYAIAGGFHDKDKMIMTGSMAAIVTLGSFPIELNKDGNLTFFGNDVSLAALKYKLYQTVGLSSYMSYLNPKNKSLNTIAENTIALGHHSVLHQIQVGIMLTGISIGVEHEFSTQRDIVHLSRLTVAKTNAQKNPCLVLRDPKHYAAYQAVLESTQKILADHEIEDSETRNLLFPTAKASGLLITGSLRNLMKLVSLKDAGGKEDEFVEALINIEKVLKEVFPEVFSK